MLAALLYAHCQKYIEGKRLIFEEQKKSLQFALTSESKSSAGDKHETGRAMLQLEMEKAGQQLTSINQMKVILDKISTENESEVVCLGSVIITNKANYYLSISAGKLIVENEDYFAVSTNSPIGQQLLGKK